MVLLNSFKLCSTLILYVATSNACLAEEKPLGNKIASFPIEVVLKIDLAFMTSVPKACSSIICTDIR